MQVAAKVEVEPFMPKENVKIETGALSHCSLYMGCLSGGHAHLLTKQAKTGCNLL